MTRNEAPSAAEFVLLNSYLRRHKPERMSQGEWNREITARIRAGSNRTRSEVAADLRSWIRTFPRRT